MARILLLVLFLLAGLLIYRRFAAGGRDGDSDSSAATQQPMVRCAQCGVFIPKTDALSNETEYFCSDAHRTLWSQTRH